MVSPSIAAIPEISLETNMLIHVALAGILFAINFTLASLSARAKVFTGAKDIKTATITQSGGQ
jgi:hypothetical protein